MPVLGASGAANTRAPRPGVKTIPRKRDKCHAPRRTPTKVNQPLLDVLPKRPAQTVLDWICQGVRDVMLNIAARDELYVGRCAAGPTVLSVLQKGWGEG
jgi:hypothetical protein